MLISKTAHRLSLVVGEVGVEGSVRDSFTKLRKAIEIILRREGVARGGGYV